MEALRQLSLEGAVLFRASERVVRSRRSASTFPMCAEDGEGLQVLIGPACSPGARLPSQCLLQQPAAECSAHYACEVRALLDDLRL